MRGKINPKNFNTMYKKILLPIVFLLAGFGQMFAQQAFHKTDKALNIGLGIGSAYYGGLGAAPIPSLNMSFETGIYEIPNIGVITAGGQADFSHTWYDARWIGADYKETYTNIVLGGRGAFHLSLLNTEKFDVYGGLLTGVRIQRWHSDYYDEYNIDYDGKDSDVYFVHDVFVGGRIMMSKKFAFFGEAGYGVSYLKVGATFKF